MEPLWILLAWLLLAVTLPGTVELLLLTVGWLLPRRRIDGPRFGPIERLTVVIPAHDEEAGLGRTLTGLLSCHRPEAEVELLVVADNCGDRTAEVAREAGAATTRTGFAVTVLERVDSERRGKGYALDHAFRTCAERGAEEAPDAFLVIDADTRVSPNLFTATTKAFEDGAEAVQVPYHSGDPERSTRARLQHVALLAFNHLRPTSREHLGVSVGILGNGFGLTAELLERVPYTASSIVEDLEYHLELVRSGACVRFVDDALVAADAPPGEQGARTQRTRWEGGRFRMIADHAPKLAGEVLRGRLRLFEPLLELLLLPLAFHVVLLLVLWLLPTSVGNSYALLALALVAVHVLAAVKVGGGSLSDLKALAVAPFYVAWKLLLLPKIVLTARSSADWSRTERG